MTQETLRSEIDMLREFTLAKPDGVFFAFPRIFPPVFLSFSLTHWQSTVIKLTEKCATLDAEVSAMRRDMQKLKGTHIYVCVLYRSVAVVFLQ